MSHIRSVVIVALLVACRGPATAPLPPPPEGLLVLSGNGRVLSVDAATGATTWSGSAVTPLGAAAPLFTTTRFGNATLLESRDPINGSTETVARIPGAWEVRAVSRDGSRVALLPPHPRGVHPWSPVPRAHTPLVVAGDGEPLRFDLKGNLEPEAFSTDGATLFMIRHLPADAPRVYRVAGLDLATGSVTPVTTRNKVLETMAGTRLSQAPAPDGRMLYTLYRSIGDGEHVAFVHTLSLSEWWAHCIGLPQEFSGGNPAQQAIAVSPDGRSVYVVDVGRGMLVKIDPGELTVGDPIRIGFGPAGDAPARMIVAGAHIMVANGRTLTTIDASTMAVVARSRLAAPATGIGADPEGRALYVSTSGGVEVLDVETSGRLELLPVDAGEAPVEVSALPL